MNGYNPMLDYQRNRLLAQQAAIQAELNNLNQFSQMNPQQAPQNPLQTQYFAKEVGGFDETKRIIPNPSEIYIFLDSANGKIYLKQMNSETGKSDYLFYNLDTSEKNIQKDPLALIDERLSKIESQIGGLYESVSGNEQIQAVQPEPCGNSDGRLHSKPVRADETAEPAEVRAGETDVKRKERKPAP